MPFENYPLGRGVRDIFEERKHQIGKGYDDAHDDGHDDGMLAIVAAELALAHTECRHPFRDDWRHEDRWDLVAKNHRDPRRCLVIAGALIAAEIDRLDRLAAKKAAT